MDTVITIKGLLIAFNITMLFFIIGYMIKVWIEHNVKTITIAELKKELGNDYKKYKGFLKD
jgi:hypothetical protein